MVEKARRGRVDEEPRAGEERAWEVLVREDGNGPLRHVGSVTAPDADEAHERATRLFAWFADDVWLCPAEEVVRYSTAAAEEGEPATPEDGSEPRTHEL